VTVLQWLSTRHSAAGEFNSCAVACNAVSRQFRMLKKLNVARLVTADTERYGSSTVLGMSAKRGTEPPIGCPLPVSRMHYSIFDEKA
jgi:hypothetical protein